MKPFQPEFYKNKRSIAAKARAQRQKESNPDHFKITGSLPKRDTGTPRGFQVIDPQLAREIQQKGVEARKAKKDMVQPDGE